MNLTEKYAPETDKTKPENKDKKIISDDAFSLVDAIDTLINKIEHARLSLIR